MKNIKIIYNGIDVTGRSVVQVDEINNVWNITISDCQHELVVCDINGKISDVMPNQDYHAICIKCGYRP